MRSHDFDVVVVGASIAGCTAATLLGRQGARVALVERRPDPAAYKAMCTHFIQASATPVIERLGLAGPIEAAGGVRNGLEAWTRYGWVRPRPGPDYRHPRYGYDIRREKLDPMMRHLFWFLDPDVVDDPDGLGRRSSRFCAATRAQRAIRSWPEAARTGGLSTHQP